MVQPLAIPTVHFRWFTFSLAALFRILLPQSASVDTTVEVPVLSSTRSNNQDDFNVMVLNWDRRGAPVPMELKWGYHRIRFKEVGLGSIAQAFKYAVEQTPSVRHTGTLTLYGASY